MQKGRLPNAAILHPLQHSEKVVEVQNDQTTSGGHGGESKWFTPRSCRKVAVDNFARRKSRSSEIEEENSARPTPGSAEHAPFES